MYHFKTLIVWRKSMELVYKIYKLTSHFPKEERYRLVSQIRRASVSIPSNIAEGPTRMRGDYKNFLIYSYGSCGELLTQLEIANNLKYLKQDEFLEIENQITEIVKILTVLIKKESNKR